MYTHTYICIVLIIHIYVCIYMYIYITPTPSTPCSPQSPGVLNIWPLSCLHNGTDIVGTDHLHEPCSSAEWDTTPLPPHEAVFSCCDCPEGYEHHATGLPHLQVMSHEMRSGHESCVEREREKERACV